MRVVCAIAFVVGASAPARATPARTSTTTVHPGIVHEHWHDTAIPAELDLVRVDLTSAEIALVATPEADKGRTTASYASKVAAAVAINGGPFAISGYRPLGLAMGDSTMWTQTADDAATAVLQFRRVGESTVASIAVPETIVTAADLPAGTQGVVSGRPLLVRAGSVEATFDCADDVAIPCTRAPRSGVGITADGNTLLVVTVDGWQTGSLGMTAGELGTFLRARGADTAMMLDSGGASTLVVDGSETNHPSDGVERAVANHLAIQYGALPQGGMQGIVCKVDLSNCMGTNMQFIAGATVTLDDGRTATSAANGFFSFGNITQRLACVTVKKTGYHSAYKCEQILPNTSIYNSVALSPGTDPVDAGVPDASETAPDGGSASELLDAGSGTHGGGGGGGGCCDAGRDGATPWVIVAGVVSACWFGSARRRRDRR